jgi:hypothetical protein
VVASRKDRYARPCRTLQETGVHRESDLRRSHRTPLPADTMQTSCCTIDSDSSRTFDPDERVRSRLESFCPVNPAAFPCHKYVAPDSPFVIESHKMLVFRPVRDLHYLHRTSNLVSHPGTSCTVLVQFPGTSRIRINRTLLSFDEKEHYCNRVAGCHSATGGTTVMLICGSASEHAVDDLTMHAIHDTG